MKRRVKSKVGYKMRAIYLSLCVFCFSLLMSCTANTVPHVVFLTGTPLPTRVTINRPTETASAYPPPPEYHAPSVAPFYPYPGVARESTAPSQVTATLSPTPVPTIFLPRLTTYPAPVDTKEMRVLYSRSDHRGYWTNTLDGQDEKKVNYWWSTNSLVQKYEMEFSPSPSENLLLFWFSGFSTQTSWQPNVNSIWINPPDGQVPQLLIQGDQDGIPINPVWSPDGSQIAYARVHYKETGEDLKGVEIKIVNKDGSNDHIVYRNKIMTYGLMGGNWILFHWYTNGYIYFSPGLEHTKLYALNPTDGKVSVLLNDVDPAPLLSEISPDGWRMKVSPDRSAEQIRSAGLFPADWPWEAKWVESGKNYYTFLPSDETRTAYILTATDASSGQRKEMYRFDKPLRKFWISPGGRFVAVATQEDELYCIDLQEHTESLIVKAENSDDVNFGALIWLPLP
jgi:hypothetical protein